MILTTTTTIVVANVFSCGRTTQAITATKVGGVRVANKNATPKATDTSIHLCQRLRYARSSEYVDRDENHQAVWCSR